MSNKNIEKLVSEDKKGYRKSKSNKIREILLITSSIIFILVVLTIIFISPLAKYLVERFDKKYTGREIKMSWAYVNPFTGYIHFDNLKIYEFKSDIVFFSANGLSANVTMSKLLSKTYEVSELTLDNPQGLLFQNKKQFNFSDLIMRFSPKKQSAEKKEPIHFNIFNIKINNGKFYYREIITPINYFIKNVNIESAGFRWDVDTIPIKFSFLSGIGSGDVKGNFTLNSKNKNYKLGVLVNKFDLNIVGQYIKDLSNYGSFQAILDADFKSKGNLIDRENVTNSGLISVSDFHFGKDSTEDFAAFDNLTFAINEISPKKFKYIFDSVSLKQPYFRYEKYDYLDNVQTMFGKKGANVSAANVNGAKYNLVIEIAKYIKTMSKNLLRSNYKVDRLAIYNGEIKYNDYSLSEKFEIELNPFTFTADSVDKTHQRVNFNIASGIKPYGSSALKISINPKDSSDFDLNYHFQNLPASIFNPYLIKYTSFPLDRGTIEVKGKWNVRNGEIKSNNHLLIIDPRVGDRLRNKNSTWLPMRLIMFFVRERGNVIDYEIPITGNLKKPNFKLKDVIFDVLENVFVKPVTTRYGVEVRNVETEIEKSLSLKWEMKNSKLTSQQEDFLKRMADFLEENEGATITVNPQRYERKEKEYILFFEAKKKYYIKYNKKNDKSFDEEDSLKVEKMSIKDSLFVTYLNEQTHDPMLFTIQDKCTKIIGLKSVNAKFKNLNKERLNVFTNYFKDNGTEKRIKVGNGKNIIPYNGFSFYEIYYKGDYPEYLLKAYRKMNELNNKSPRKKFKRERNKNLKTQ